MTKVTIVHIQRLSFQIISDCVSKSRKVSYNYNIFWQSLTLGIDTKQDHVKAGCTERKYGQLGNRDLHPVLDQSRCWHNFTTGLHRCKGTLTVQDFVPREFSFSFGFECDWIHDRTQDSSLKRIILQCECF